MSMQMQPDAGRRSSLMARRVLLVSANPDTFTRASLGRRIGVVRVDFLLDDFDGFIDGQFCLRLQAADAGDA